MKRTQRSPEATEVEFFHGDLYGELILVKEYGDAASRRTWCLRLCSPFLVCVAAVIAAHAIADRINVEPVIMAMALGLAISFIVRSKHRREGYDILGGFGMRAGVALLGLQIDVNHVVSVGSAPFVGLLCVMTIAVLGGLAGARLASQSRYAGVLAGCATAICGVSAAVALYAVIGKDRLPRAQFAVILVGLLLASTLVVVVHTSLADLLGLDNEQAAFIFGTTVHDAAQAIAAGYAFSDAAGAETTVLKMTRVALLAPALFIVASLIGRQNDLAARNRSSSLRPPLFLLTFIALAVVNTFAPIPATIAILGADLAKASLVFAIAAILIGVRIEAFGRHAMRQLVPLFSATAVSSAAAFGLLYFI